MSRSIVATVDELPPGGRKRVTVRGRDIAVFRIGDEYHAIQDRCPHEGASLCAGRVVGLAVSDRPGTYSLTRHGELLRCPWHGWEFDIRTGRSWTDPERIRVRSFQTSVESGARLKEGPFVAETFPVTVDRDYVLVETGPPGWVDAVVRRRTDAAEGIVELELQRADGASLLPFEAGAHIDVELGAGLVRQYSLTGDPARHDTYRIAVLREPQSRGGSRAVHDILQEGVPVRIGVPRTNFRLAPNASRSILIAGGIGVTPLIAMAYRLSREGADYTFHYLARTPARAAFLDELTSGPIGPHLQPHFDGVPGSAPFELEKVLETSEGADVYVCGPPGLIDAVAATHLRLGLPPSTLHMERFSASVELTGQPFTVEAARSGKILHVPGDRTVAEVLVEHGVPVNLSCEQGVCGTCLVAVLDGRPEHRDSFQSQEEKAANTQMTVCCSRAYSPKLVLDV